MCFHVDISFEQRVRPVAVNIYETYHPGSVVRIWATDGFDKWKLLWEGSPQVRDHMPYIFSPPINKINFYTRYYYCILSQYFESVETNEIIYLYSLLRLEFDHSHLDYYTEIDAVSMTGILEPSEAVISHFVCDASLYCKPPECEDKSVSIDKIALVLNSFSNLILRSSFVEYV